MCFCFYLHAVCPFGSQRTLNANDASDDVIVDVIGDLNDPGSDPRDALSGSGDTLLLCKGNVFFVKRLCPEAAEGFVLSLSFTVSGVDSVKVVFLDASSMQVDMETVSCISFAN